MIAEEQHLPRTQLKTVRNCEVTVMYCGPPQETSFDRIWLTQYSDSEPLNGIRAGRSTPGLLCVAGVLSFHGFLKIAVVGQEVPPLRKRCSLWILSGIMDVLGSQPSSFREVRSSVVAGGLEGSALGVSLVSNSAVSVISRLFELGGTGFPRMRTARDMMGI